ncbi:alkaline phosphatase family protein [Gemmata sp. JC673]|uniref:Alkaline phosphatase family protein n=1 Tax=Gemmata algarum TaxID=2975278 RepID=A0ABU5F222_9BACT|nr:alkaline phosphatase family protein [Gemmata algarum]MDY3561633.1 alkaline phosphatase family protein [Gemmata algarum]
MSRFWLAIAAVFLLFVAAGVGGYFLIRPAPPDGPPRQREQPPGAAQPVPPAPSGAAAESPKLVVLFVFDQMRGDYLERWAPLFGPDGFERIKKDGVWFSECHIPYACTSTAPGHASLSTGAAPRDHGIIENEWFDREKGVKVYCCEPVGRAYELVPPLASASKDLNRGAATGYSPERLLVPTVADALREQTGRKGRVFSLSIKDRTAVLMGGQDPSGAYCFDTRDGRFHTGAWYGRKSENFREHAWVKELNDSKLVDSWFNTSWDRLRPKAEADYLKFAGPDDALGEADGFNGQGRTFPHALKGKLTAPAKKYYDAVEGSPYGNELLAALARKAVTAENLGRGDAPDLLCVSFSSNDLLGHRWGPDSQEMLDVTLRSDQLVGEFLSFLDEKVGKGRYTLVVSADHGVCPLPELKKYPAAQRVMIGELTTGLPKALDAMFGADPAAPWVAAFDEDTWPWVYLNQKSIKARNLDPDKVTEAAAAWLAGRGYIDTTFTRKQIEDGQFPADQPFKKSVALAYRPDRCGDVIVIPKAGVQVTPYKGGTGHGSPHPYDTHIPFLAYGAGVPALGKRTEKVSSLAVAPTLAQALGIKPPRAAALPAPDALTKTK